MTTTETTPRELIGVCSECGMSIYDEANVGTRSPKLRCASCVGKETRLRESKHRSMTSFFKKSLIIPAILLGALAIALCVMILMGDSQTKLVDCLTMLGLAVLIYMPLVQFIWQTEPIATIVEWAFTKPSMSFGLIFELDLDGILWFLTVKLLLWMLSVLLLIAAIIIGLILCVVISPISFPFALAYAIRNVDDIGWD